tara:strand:+ start:197 stop:451 length:255 start_codon:yes stop_codon:yes gene_type:complete
MGVTNMAKDNIIQFPTTRTRVGKKYRQEEIQRIKDLLQLCDEDMATIVEQIEQLNIELNVLTKEYEVLMERLKKLLKVEGEKND